MKTALLTILALVAFAGNSVLCRMALGDSLGDSLGGDMGDGLNETRIDAAGFTIIRLLSGIVALLAILKITRSNSTDTAKGSWKASVFLFLYAITFSYAYISLDTGIGALILFASVQAAMITVGILSGDKLHYLEWLGLFVAFSGFVYLVLPDLTSPSLLGFLLMTVSGIAWGFYTLAGTGSKYPLADTSYNFLRTLPFVILLLVLSFQHITLTTQGVILAVLSGALASGIGYTIWYTVLRHLTGIQAAVVQLLVPVIAAAGGTIFSNEAVTSRLVQSSVMILGGILMVILTKHYSKKTAP